MSRSFTASSPLRLEEKVPNPLCYPLILPSSLTARVSVDSLEASLGPFESITHTSTCRFPLHFLMACMRGQKYDMFFEFRFPGMPYS